MNYYNYPYNYYFVNPSYYQPLYQTIQPIYYSSYCFQPLQPYYTRQTQLLNVTQWQSHTITDYNLPPQQDMVDQELLRDTIIAIMKQLNNKLWRVFADVADLIQSENPVEYILKAATLLKEILTTKRESL